MKPAARVLSIGFLIGAAFAFQHAVEPAHRPLELKSPVQDKNFYLLSAMQRNSGARESIRKDARLAADRLAALNRTTDSCNTDIECNAGAFRWTDSQIADGSRALAALYPSAPAIRTLAGELRVSGAYLVTLPAVAVVVATAVVVTVVVRDREYGGL